MKNFSFAALLISMSALAQVKPPVAAVFLKETQEKGQINCLEGELFRDDELKAHIYETEKVISKLNDRQSPGLLYLSWGYNRGFHSNSDITVSTPDGKFTIRDAQGIDRPKKLGPSYLDPRKFTVPQYNVRIGYWPSEESKLGFEAGTDHMKWVFDPDHYYEIEGDYKDVWMNGEKVSFDEVKAAGYAKFFLMEHSDGYNYPFLGVIYREKIVNSRKVGLEFLGGAHVGILFPKTRTRIADREDGPQYRDKDNKFHVAGLAGSIDLRMRLKYKLKNGASLFLEPAVRGVAGKVNNALFIGKGSGRISQTMMYTTQPMISGGAEIPIRFFKRKKVD